MASSCPPASHPGWQAGANYRVALFPDGVTAGGTVNVTQLQIASAEVIPAGTSVIVTKAGPNYVMQVAVWL